MFYHSNKEKKFNKKAVLFTILVLTLLILFLMLFLLPLFNKTLGMSAYAQYSVYKVINNNTKLFNSSKFVTANEVKRLSSGTQVDVLEEGDTEEGDTYYYVQVGEVKGYLRHWDVEKINQLDSQYSVENVKATTKKLGDKIKLYTKPSEDAEVALEVRDGQKLQIIDEGIKDYYSVILNQETYFVKKDNVTSKLSQSQLTALIVSIVSSTTVLIIFSIIYLSKNLKNKHTHRSYINRM